MLLDPQLPPLGAFGIAKLSNPQLQDNGMRKKGLDAALPQHGTQRTPFYCLVHFFTQTSAACFVIPERNFSIHVKQKNRITSFRGGIALF